MHPEVLRLLSLWDLIWETTPSVKKLKGDHQQLADLEMSWHLRALEKSSAISERTERTPIPLGNWVHSYLPGDEIWLKIKRRNLFSQFEQALTWSSWKPLLLLKLQCHPLDPPHQNQEGRGFLWWGHLERRDPKNLLKVRFQRQGSSTT